MKGPGSDKDRWHCRGWILDAGDYYFTVANGAHKAINNVLANKLDSTDALTAITDYEVFDSAKVAVVKLEKDTEYFDKAFEWAKKYGIQILIDLYTCPGSQSGYDNGGLTGVCKWCKNPKEVEFELTVLERLAERYARGKGDRFS